MRGVRRGAAGPVLALVVAPVLAVAGCGGSHPPGGASATGSASSGPHVTQLDTGAVGVAEVDGGAWTVLFEDGSVRTAAGHRIPVGDAPLRIVGTPDGAWVSVIRDGTVVRIDP